MTAAQRDMAAIRNWNEQGEGTHAVTIEPLETARVTPWLALSLLRRIVRDGVTVRLGKRGTLALTSRRPLSDADEGEIIASGAVICDLMADRVAHRDCSSGRPSFIPGMRWAIRCSQCKKPLRRRRAAPNR